MKYLATNFLIARFGVIAAVLMKIRAGQL